MCAMYVIRATCFPYADLPEPFAPVTIICCQFRLRHVMNHATEIAVCAAVQHSVVVDVARVAVDGVQQMNTLANPQHWLFLHDWATEVQPFRRIREGE